MEEDNVVDSIYQNIPDDDEEAFLYLERHFRRNLDDRINDGSNRPQIEYYTEGYANAVIAAVGELKLDVLQSWVQSPKRIESHEQQAFMFDVDNAKTQISIRLSRRNREMSVTLDANSRVKIRHLTEQIKQHLDSLEVDDQKKETLFSKLNSFIAEVDRDRTKFQAYAALATDVAVVSSRVASEAAPLARLLFGIAQIIGLAKEEETPRLMGPKQHKRIEGPKPPAKERPAPPSDLDDEIPF